MKLSDLKKEYNIKIRILKVDKYGYNIYRIYKNKKIIGEKWFSFDYNEDYISYKLNEYIKDLLS